MGLSNFTPEDDDDNTGGGGNQSGSGSLGSLFGSLGS